MSLVELPPVKPYREEYFVGHVDRMLQHHLGGGQDEFRRDYQDNLDHFTPSAGGKFTGERWLNVIKTYTQEYDPVVHLGVTFPKVNKGAGAGKFDSSFVLQRNIPFRGLCAHHLLPVLGVAHVAYIPKDKLVGLSKLARVVYGYSHHMPSTQEQVGEWIVEALQAHLEPLGSAVVIDAEHTCMSARGVQEPGVTTTTAALRGVFTSDAAARAELYNHIARQ